MNPSTACGRTLVDELVRCGVREAVVSPGSTRVSGIAAATVARRLAARWPSIAPPAEVMDGP